MNWGENIAIKYALFKGDLVIFTACPMYRIRMKMMGIGNCCAVYPENICTKDILR